MFWHFIKHLFLHELDCNDTVLAEVVALVDDSVVAFTERFWAIDVVVVVDLLHALHWFKIEIINDISSRDIQS